MQFKQNISILVLILNWNENIVQLFAYIMNAGFIEHICSNICMFDSICTGIYLFHIWELHNIIIIEMNGNLSHQMSDRNMAYSMFDIYESGVTWHLFVTQFIPPS